jgi:hypothetical protein
VPVFVNAVASLSIFALVHKLSPSLPVSYSFLGAILFQLFDFPGLLTTATPFTLGHILFYSFVLVAGALAVSRIGTLGSKPFIIISAVFVSALSVSYPLTSVEGAFCISALCGYALFNRMASMRSLVWLPIVLFLIIGGWSAFFSGSILTAFSGILTSSLSRFISSLVGGTAQSLNQTSPAHSFVNSAKVMVLAAVIIGAIPSLLRGVFRRIEVIRRIFVVFLGLAISAVFLAGIQGMNYGVYFFTVVLPFLIFLDLVTLSNLKVRSLKVFVLILLVVSTPASLLVVYGNVNNESPGNPMIGASTFYSSYRGQDVRTETLVGFQLGSYGSDLGTLYPYTNQIILPDSEVPAPIFYLPAFHDVQTYKVDFVVIGNDAYQVAKYTTGSSSSLNSFTTAITSSTVWQLAYSSGHVEIFARLGSS